MAIQLIFGAASDDWEIELHGELRPRRSRKQSADSDDNPPKKKKHPTGFQPNPQTTKAHGRHRAEEEASA